MFQMIQQAMQNKSDPMELFNSVTKGRTPEQMNAFYKRVEQMGFSPDIINKLKG